MKCKKCQNMAVLHANSSNPCLKCGEEISTPHMPCDKVCESCSDKHKVCQLCGESMDSKKKFGISELKTEYAYSKHLQKEVHKCGNNFADHAIEILNRSFQYSDWLNETKLTSELVEKLFKGFKKEQKRDSFLAKRFVIDGAIEILFYPSHIKANTKKEQNQTIETLADLARLTAAKPIPLT